MTYLDRKLSGRCCRRGCSVEGLDTMYCAPHWEDQKRRNRDWKARSKRRTWTQLSLLSTGEISALSR